MSGRRALRVSHGVTNAGTTSRSQRRGTASAQLAARLSSRAGGPLLGSASTPALGRSRSNQPDDFNASKVDGGDSPLPPLGGWAEGVLPRPNTTTGAFGRPSSSDPGPLKELEAGESGQLFTPPSSSGNGTFSGSAARSGIPLGLSKLGREDLEVYVDIVRATLAREAKKDQPAAVVDDEAIQVNNIPHVGTQSDFRALIKAQNIPHPSYDIDGDGVVSQEDYALAKRFDINGDGILDEAEKVVGRRIMAEMFLENHQHDMHLYGQGLAQKARNANRKGDSMTANVDDISRSRGFKKIMSGLREKEKNFVNHGSEGVKECVTLKAKSLTRHNFFSDKFDTTAWNDFTRDPRDADWLESRRHDGSRNQMYFMRKVEARESA
ncbi:unnamed protein product, partial [Pylaiella littoralis]